MAIGPLLMVPRTKGESYRIFIEERGLSDPARRVHSTPKFVAIPIEPTALERWLEKNPKHSLESYIGELMKEDEISLTDGPAPTSQPSNDPHTKLRSAVQKEVRDAGFDAGIEAMLLDNLPSKWERLGDVVLFPQTAFRDESWNLLISKRPHLFETLTSVLSCNRLGRQGEIQPGPIRKSGAELLFGEGGWVIHPENHVNFHFDFTQSMLSSGNVSERSRVSLWDCQGEDILDLYAGIGYWTLPLLVNASAHHITACEWNPPSVEGLRRSLANNRIRKGLKKGDMAIDHCTIIEGDNKTLLDSYEHRSRYDRVILGLLPQSKDGWMIAVEALKEGGGWLHVHGNARVEDEDKWACDVTTEIANIATNSGRSLEVELFHLERVKWYAPKVRHLVADIKITN